MNQEHEKQTKRMKRGAVGGAGIGAAAATVGVAVANANGVHIDPATEAAVGSLFTAFFGWLGHML